MTTIEPLPYTTEVQTLWLMDLWAKGHKATAARTYREYKQNHPDYNRPHLVPDGQFTLGDYDELQNYFKKF